MLTSMIYLKIGIDKIIVENSTEITFKVNPETEYTLNFQVIYENGLRSLINVISFKSAPEISEPFVVDRSHGSIKIIWDLNPEISEYEIYHINKGEKGEERLAEATWHGKDLPAEIYGLEAYKQYKFALIGYIKNGVTNSQEFIAKTRLPVPEIDWDHSKVGWTSAVITWKKIPKALGYQIVIYNDWKKTMVHSEAILPVDETVLDISDLEFETPYVFDILASHTSRHRYQ